MKRLAPREINGRSSKACRLCVCVPWGAGRSLYPTTTVNPRGAASPHGVPGALRRHSSVGAGGLVSGAAGPVVRAAWRKILCLWEHDRNDALRWRCAAQGEEEASFVSEMDVLLGSRYCKPTKMSAPQQYNDVKTDALQLCVQGTFTVEGYAKGRTDTRWQTIGHC